MSTPRDATWSRSLEGATELLTTIETTARKAFEVDGHCQPVALLWSFRTATGEVKDHAQTFVLGTQFMDEFGKDKEMFSEVLRDLAARMDAFALAFVSESRTIQLDKRALDMRPGETEAQAVARWRKAHAGSFEKIPGYKEIVLITFEHCALRGSCLSIAEITREVQGDELSKGTLHEFKRSGGFPEGNPDGFKALKGRFVGLLPGARGD